MELDPRQPLAGDIWDTSIPATAVHSITDTDLLQRAEVRISRHPDWNGYFVLPLYKMYRIETQEDRETVIRIEGPNYLTEEDTGNIIIDHIGVIGVQSQDMSLIHTKDVLPQRHLYGAHLFDPFKGYAVVTNNPMDAILLMSVGIENVLAAMQKELSPAQILWLSNHARRGIILVNTEAPDEILKTVPLYREPMPLDITKKVRPKPAGLQQRVMEVTNG